MIQFHLFTGVSLCCVFSFFFSSRRRHTSLSGDWSSDVCSSDLQEGILLGLVETMNLIDEQERPPAIGALLLGASNYLFNLLDPGGDGRERLEGRLTPICQQEREGRLTGTRRSP